MGHWKCKGDQKGSQKGKGYAFQGMVNPNNNGWGYQGVCFRCQKVGHKQTECPETGLQQVGGFLEDAEKDIRHNRENQGGERTALSDSNLRQEGVAAGGCRGRRSSNIFPS